MIANITETITELNKSKTIETKELLICHMLRTGLSDQYMIFDDGEVIVYNNFVDFFTKFNSLAQSGLSVSMECILRSEFHMLEHWKNALYTWLKEYNLDKQTMPETFNANQCTAIWIFAKY